MTVRAYLPSPRRLCFLLTVAVGVLSVLTGIINITYTPVPGPLAPIVPEPIQATAGFTGALTGFLVILGAYGLTRGYRVAWWLTVLLLPITALQGIVQATSVSVPLVVLSLVGIPVLVVNRSRFGTPLALTAAQIGAVIALAGVMTYGTVGSYALRDQFTGMETVLDAFYFTFVTATTVGYGDMTATTQVARLFGLTVLALGVTTFAVVAGVLIGPIIESRLAASLGRVKTRELNLLEDHIVVLGAGDLVDEIIAAIPDREQVVVVTDQSLEGTALTERDVLVYPANQADGDALEAVAIGEARAAIVATDDDAEDAFAILSVRAAVPDLRVVAMATNAENVSKLERAGADVVVDPADVGASLLVEQTMAAGDSE